MAQAAEHKVHHDEKTHRFYIESDGETITHMDYRPQGDSSADFYRTYTPEEHRGRGLAAEVVQHALDWARHHDVQVIPSCSFVRSFIDQNPEYEAVATRPE